MRSWTRARVRLRRARRRRLAIPNRGRLLTVATLAVAALMVTVSALSSHGSDLRPAAASDLVDLLNAESRRNAELADQAASLRAEVDELAAGTASGAPDPGALSELSLAAGMTAVAGPAVSVTLDDAPLSVKPAGIDADLLVVHQQDIQAVANALWQGGAEAMTIQGQRVTGRTGIKCVGNTVVLHGVPYAPPYVITAIGDVDALEAALADSEYLHTYREYARVYRLGFDQQALGQVTLPAFRGATDTSYARAR